MTFASSALWLVPLVLIITSISVCFADTHVRLWLKIDQIMTPFNLSGGDATLISCSDSTTPDKCENIVAQIKFYDTFDARAGKYNYRSFVTEDVTNFFLDSTVVNDTDRSTVSILKERPVDLEPTAFEFKGLYPDYILVNVTLRRGPIKIDWWVVNLTAKWDEEKASTVFGNYDLFPFGKRNALVITHYIRCQPTWFPSKSASRVCVKQCVEEEGIKMCDKFGNHKCAENKHGRNCRKRCVPSRNEKDGYFGCDANGRKICAKGAEKPKCAVPFCDKAWCKNGGSCRIVKKEVKCICLPGFSGERCETKSTCDSPTPKLWPTKEEAERPSCMDTFSCRCFRFKDDPECHKILESYTKFGEFMAHWGNFIALVSVTVIALVALPLSTWILTIVIEKFGYLD